ncbi:aminotransferase class I/II-fold pyridoxal phosphate-dependent enzyme [Bombilactobacillus folatiphilus]|uniref:Aminotransferase n=1 Tax=Bombilactobacillus folatiphilus TaxID=2923362 RepID=A0ABY4P8K6_9LACO|nr:aminotransferase class I/II-fold pyridoxal phosphate-dependent enzyme [Bombilactobacillus folatiphilus]UQS81925.1 aminotransferase class I/II-fold pyridoxal phosphate-dependent enzyme [Bombilactobacillus folatiphilus]
MSDLETKMNTNALKLKPQDIFLFNARANQTPGVINMTVGEPDFLTPEHIRNATSQAILHEGMHYTIPEGKPELTQAIAAFLNKKYNLHYDPQTQIVTTIGVTESVFTTLTAILNPGDEVILPTPCFTIYEPDILLNQATPVYLNTSQTDFRVDPAALQKLLQQHPKTKAIILNYPNNPTGVTYNRQELTALAQVLKQFEIFVLSDEIYSELSFAGQHVSFAELLPEQTILMNGLSKSHAMTGWRVGYVCGPQNVMQHLLHVHELVTTSLPEAMQDAAIDALTKGQDDPQAMKAEYQRRRDYLQQQLEELGITTSRPQGAFYMFMKLPAQVNQDDVVVANELLEQEQLALLPGSFFGLGGSGYLRISYAASMEKIKLAVTKLADYLQKVGVN